MLRDDLARTRFESGVFGAIDWRQPWLVPFRALAIRILRAADWRLALNTAAAEINLRNHRWLPIRFVPQQNLPADVPYEWFISETGCVPTRENLHDFFNALVWLTYPAIKIRLNALQTAEIEKATASLDANTKKPGKIRGGVRDAATIFDENAALMVTSEPGLIDALRTHDWLEVFISRRDVFRARCELRLFGHALVEKLVAPYKAITAHTWPLIVDAAFFDMSEQRRREWIDDAIARQLASGLAMAHFMALPVLGVPGWSDHQDEAFYGDKEVFRPKKK